MRAVAIGESAKALLARTAPLESSFAVSVTKALAEVVDASFLEHCRVGLVRCGVLTVMVDDVRMLHPLRLQWVMTLTEHMEERHPALGIRQVKFAAG